jgi:hypothetical protein
MSDTKKPSGLILTGRHTKEDAALERKMARKLVSKQIVDFVLQYKGAERWLAVQRVWLKIHPLAQSEHRQAKLEAARVRELAFDKEFGRTAQNIASHKGGVLGSNNWRQIAVFPESLQLMLKQFDPLNLANKNGVEHKKIWHRVYKAFPEYLTVEKL